MIRSDAQLSRFLWRYLAACGEMRSDANRHERAGIMYELSFEEARFTVHIGTGAALRPPGRRSWKLICALSHFRQADQVQTCSGEFSSTSGPRRPRCISVFRPNRLPLCHLCLFTCKYLKQSKLETVGVDVGWGWVA